MFDTEVFVIGAGPFGLSISAYLSALGVDHRVAGRPMDTWRAHMPDGMLMKSEPYASTIASPDGRYDVEAYCKSSGLDYMERVGPLTRERFLDYADWYTKQLVPDILDDTVTEVARVDGGFRLSFAAAKPVTARQVVVATGVLPHRHLPAELAGLPSELVTHTADHHDLGVFQGRRVVVVGAGQSALETAALLHEAGVEVQVIARTPVLSWSQPNPAHLSALGKLKRPVTQLCEGWRCYFWNTPRAFRALPEDYRVRKAKTVLGPNGSWWLRDRFHGVVDALPGHRVREAVADGSGVKLLLDGPNSVGRHGRPRDRRHRVPCRPGSAVLPPGVAQVGDQEPPRPSRGEPRRADLPAWPVLRGLADRLVHRAVLPVHRRHSHASGAAHQVDRAPRAGCQVTVLPQPPPAPIFGAGPPLCP